MTKSVILFQKYRVPVQLIYLALYSHMHIYIYIYIYMYPDVVFRVLLVFCSSRRLFCCVGAFSFVVSFCLSNPQVLNDALYFSNKGQLCAPSLFIKAVECKLFILRRIHLLLLTAQQLAQKASSSAPTSPISSPVNSSASFSRSKRSSKPVCSSIDLLRNVCVRFPSNGSPLTLHLRIKRMQKSKQSGNATSFVVDSKAEGNKLLLEETPSSGSAPPTKNGQNKGPKATGQSGVRTPSLTTIGCAPKRSGDDSSRESSCRPRRRLRKGIGTSSVSVNEAVTQCLKQDTPGLPGMPNALNSTDLKVSEGLPAGTSKSFSAEVDDTDDDECLIVDEVQGIPPAVIAVKSVPAHLTCAHAVEVNSVDEYDDELQLALKESLEMFRKERACFVTFSAPSVSDRSSAFYSMHVAGASSSATSLKGGLTGSHRTADKVVPQKCKFNNLPEGLFSSSSSSCNDVVVANKSSPVSLCKAPSVVDKTRNPGRGRASLPPKDLNASAILQKSRSDTRLRCMKLRFLKRLGNARCKLFGTSPMCDTSLSMTDCKLKYHLSDVSARILFHGISKEGSRETNGNEVCTPATSTENTGSKLRACRNAPSIQSTSAKATTGPCSRADHGRSDVPNIEGRGPNVSGSSSKCLPAMTPAIKSDKSLGLLGSSGLCKCDKWMYEDMELLGSTEMDVTNAKRVAADMLEDCGGQSIENWLDLQLPPRQSKMYEAEVRLQTKCVSSATCLLSSS